MTLSGGAHLGPYEILSPLGAGGMGEVYRARDARLGREVAIKVLPAAFSADADRLRRFELEAKAAGVLNHPNILAIYDIGTVDGSPYVVSELLEGETLRSRLAGGALPPRKAIDYALQIAHGLAAAHEKGIVHRDLKPENLFVTKDGRVKILDFGLAKLTRPEEGTSGETNLPTLTAGTEPGVVLGTLGYMSPEQARGKPSDHRSDIFSFGAILYEMLSGRRAFHGETAADTLTAILKEEPPDLSATSRNIPPGLERIARHCLEKNREERFHSAHDLAFDLEALSGISAAAAPAVAGAGVLPGLKLSRLSIPVGFGLAGILVGIGLARFLFHPPAAEPPPFRYLTYSGKDWAPAASPDGKTVAFTSSRDGLPRIWLKQIAGGSEVALTSGPDTSPRFSPDGSAILFTRFEGREASLYRIAVLGGEPRKLIADARQGDWSPDGQQIAYLRTKNEGGRPVSILGMAGADGGGGREIARVPDQVLHAPRWSPDGRWIAVWQGGARVPSAILLVRTDGKERRTISPPEKLGLPSAVAWSGSGSELVYAQAEAVTAGYRSSSGRVLLQNIRSGRARAVLWRPSMGGGLDILGPGRLVFDADSSHQNLQEISLAGSGSAASKRWLTRGISTDRQPVYSPDGEWVLFSSDRAGNNDLWKVSTKSGALRRLTEDPGEDWDPAFTPDGKKILWSSNRGGHFEIWTADADGSGARQVSNDGVDAENPGATRDGAWIVYNSFNPSKRGLWKIRPDGSQATRIVTGRPIGGPPEVSPDGRYVVYRLDALERRYFLRVARISDGTVAFEIPVPTGFSLGRARWMPKGDAIAFLGRNEKGVEGIFVQEFIPGQDTSKSRRPVAVFDPDLPTESFGISPDGSRMVISVLDQQSGVMLAEGVPGISPPAHRAK